MSNFKIFTTMKKITLFLVALLSATFAFADKVEIDGICYNLNNGNKNAEVTYQCEYSYSDHNYSDITSITIPQNVTYNATEYSVTSIGEWAFSKCSSLTSITIPNSVTSIGYSAFANCYSLTSITIPNSETSIGEHAFYICTSLTSITIGNNVTSIGEGAFYDCKSLTSITCLGSTPPEASNLHVNISTCTLIVPKVAYNNYLRHAYWGQFVNIETIDVDYKKLTAIANNAECGVVEGSDYYNNGDEAILTAIPYYGYSFVKWSDEVTDNPRTVVVTEDSTFTAIFEANTFAITTTVNDDAIGSVTEGGEYAYGTEITLTATANEGYRFVKWSDGNTENPRTVVVTQDSTFTAIFEANVFSVITAVNDDTMGSVTEDGEYTYGSEITLTATANEGYRFAQWSDGNTDNPRTVVVTQDSTFTAIFEENNFIITTSVNDDAIGSVTEGGEYAYGTEITLTATANDGYRFAQWSDGNIENPRTVTVTENKTYTAEFELNTYTLIANSYNPNMGGVKITLTAEPIKGFEFIGWSDGSTENPYQFYLTENTELYAYFQIAQGGTTVDIETSKISSANIYTQNGTLHIDGATTDYHILDAAGRLIYSGNATTLTLPRGIYLITINGEVEKIVL